jgi:hypothetical protein
MCGVPMGLVARTTGSSDIVQIDCIHRDSPQLQPSCGERLLELRIERKQARVAEMSIGTWLPHQAIKNANEIGQS